MNALATWGIPALSLLLLAFAFFAPAKERRGRVASDTTGRRQDARHYALAVAPEIIAAGGPGGIVSAPMYVPRVEAEEAEPETIELDDEWEPEVETPAQQHPELSAFGSDREAPAYASEPARDTTFDVYTPPAAAEAPQPWDVPAPVAASAPEWDPFAMPAAPVPVHDPFAAIIVPPPEPEAAPEFIAPAAGWDGARPAAERLDAIDAAAAQGDDAVLRAALEDPLDAIAALAADALRARDPRSFSEALDTLGPERRAAIFAALDLAEI